ncbi:MAG: hypothetical protein IKO62_07990 [Bacteroidales bacterium]|nr:hypothetical protein [Bacteroidales bacterium]
MLRLEYCNCIFPDSVSNNRTSRMAEYMIMSIPFHPIHNFIDKMNSINIQKYNISLYLN